MLIAPNTTPLDYLLPVRKLAERDGYRPDVVIAEGVFFPALEDKNRGRVGHVELEGLVVSGRREISEAVKSVQSREAERKNGGDGKGKQRRYNLGDEKYCTVVLQVQKRQRQADRGR